MQNDGIKRTAVAAVGGFFLKHYIAIIFVPIVIKIAMNDLHIISKWSILKLFFY
jgi:putative effector of murein hydrolase LrgA (UPF0299 family)